MASKIELLRDLSVGRRVAEEEVNELSRYFVETDQWRRIVRGEVDIVFGAKGAGKSAIYASLLSRSDDLHQQGIILIAGENPRGATAFADLVPDPPTSELEFIGLWKLFIITLIARAIGAENLECDESRQLSDALAAAGLGPAPGGLRALLARVRQYMQRLTHPDAFETELKLDANGRPTGFVARIVLGEPTPDERDQGALAVADLFDLAASTLSLFRRQVWVLFDRLDVAFAEHEALEANALRALFKVYLDLAALSEVRLKIFLRSDIWQSITTDGFREASHITRDVTISWSRASLLNLVVKRLLDNEFLITEYDVDRLAVLSSTVDQRRFFDRLVPEKIDLGRNPATFEWILNRVSDGTGAPAPREVIHLLTKARDEQLAMLERGETEPEGDLLFSRQAFREALPEVGSVRLGQTLFAEYPSMRPYLEALRRQKTNQTGETLAAIWNVSTEQALEIAGQLASIGFFTVRGNNPEYKKVEFWVPFIYRDALEMVQGSAD